MNSVNTSFFLTFIQFTHIVAVPALRQALGENNKQGSVFKDSELQFLMNNHDISTNTKLLQFTTIATKRYNSCFKIRTSL